MDEQEKTVTVQAVCGNCAFWKKVDMAGPVQIGAPPRGNCFAMPPTPCAIFAQNMRQVVGQVNIRPATAANDTCGMFAPSQDALDEAGASE